jgi:hypothetical protein
MTEMFLDADETLEAFKQNEDESVKAYQAAYSSHMQKDDLDRNSVLKPDKKRMKRVTERAFYRDDFATYLKQRFAGCTVAEVSRLLDVDEYHVVNVLNGTWKPSKDFVAKLGLKIVYAIPETEPVPKLRR